MKAKGAPSAMCRHLEALGQRGDAVAMAHPDLVARPAAQRPSNSGHSFSISTKARPNSRWWPAFDLAAELLAHGLLAVADAEHRHAAVEDDLRRARAADVERRGRAARKDDRLRLQALEAFFGRLERHDLGIDAGLAHAAGDQLRDLAAEIDDENGVGMCCLGHDERFRRLALWGHGEPFRSKAASSATDYDCTPSIRFAASAMAELQRPSRSPVPAHRPHPPASRR